MEYEVILAVQQFLGYSHAKRGYGIVDLIKTMGLSHLEWKAIKEDGTHTLSANEVSEIDEYFN